MSDSAPEFSRPVELGRLGSLEAVYPIAATPAEREALARRFDLLALERLEAEIRLQRLARGMVRLSGRFAAEVTQACVVSLEPVASNLAGEFTVLYGPGGSDETVVMDYESELIEPLEGSAIDIGEAVAQQLAVALDPYPRAAGASLGWSGGSAASDEG
ncbi:MAG TPA: DUF177 domain-containing protein [Stellaceae bacterium]|nr:DUF177 domain-containing protein [Stellaceae bacterium]